MEPLQSTNSTEKKILKAAKTIFTDKGYHETSMSAIAEKADLGKGTLYWHFDSKAELFQSMITQEAKAILDELDQLSESDLGAEEILKEFIRIRLQRMLEHRKTSQMFMDGENYINQDFKKTMFKIYKSFIELLKDTIDQGIAEGVFETENPRKAASCFIGMINGICSEIILVKEDADFDLEKNTEFIYNLFINGLKSKEA